MSRASACTSPARGAGVVPGKGADAARRPRVEFEAEPVVQRLKDRQWPQREVLVSNRDHAGVAVEARAEQMEVAAGLRMKCVDRRIEEPGHRKNNQRLMLRMVTCLCDAETEQCTANVRTCAAKRGE